MPLSWTERIYEMFVGEYSSDKRREMNIEREFIDNMARKVQSNDMREIAIGIQGLKQMESADPNNPLLRRLPASVHKRRISFESANLSRLNLSRVNSANTNLAVDTMSSSYATSISSRAPSIVNVPRRTIPGGGLASIQEVAHPVGRKGPSRPAIDYIQLLYGDNRTINGKCPRWITHEGTAWEGYYEAGPECELFHVSDNLPNAPGFKAEVVEDLYPLTKEPCVGEHSYIYRADSTKDERAEHALQCMDGKPDLICHLLGPNQAITSYDGVMYHDVMRRKHDEDFPKGTVQEPAAEQIQEPAAEQTQTRKTNVVRGFKPETTQQKAQRLDKVVHAAPWNANEKGTSRVNLIHEHYTKPQKTRFVNPAEFDVLDLYDEFDYDKLETEQTSRMCIPGWTKAINAPAIEAQQGKKGKARATQAQQGKKGKARATQAQQGKSPSSMPAHPIMRLVSLPAEPLFKPRKVTVHEFYKPESRIDIIKAALQESHAATKLKNSTPPKKPVTKEQVATTASPAKSNPLASSSAKPSADLYAKSLGKAPAFFASGPAPKLLVASAFHPPQLPDATVTTKILHQPVPSVVQDLPTPGPSRPLRRVRAQPNLEPKPGRSTNLSVTNPLATNPAAKPAIKPTNPRGKSGGVQFAVDLPPKEREAQAAKQNQEEQECQMRAARDVLERQMQRAAKRRMKEFRVAEAKALKLKRAQGDMGMGMAMGMPSGMAMALSSAIPKSTTTSGSTTPKATPLAVDNESTPRASILNKHLQRHNAQVALALNMQIPDLDLGRSKLVPEDLPEEAVESDEEDASVS